MTLRKNIIPFFVSASSGFSMTISSIQELKPEAMVVESGLEVLSSKTEDFTGMLERMEDVS